MTQYGIAFAPLVPMLVLWLGLAATLVIVAFSLLRRARGALWRALALAMVLLALANPSFTRESREPLPSVAAVIVDKSPSQSFGDRAKQTDAARDALLEKLRAIKGFDVRVSDAGQADGETDGTKLFSALSATLSDVPTDRIAGAFFITDGSVHDIPASAETLGFQAPVPALISGHSGERDRRIAIVASPREGELTPGNNRAVVAIDGVRDKLRVLLVSGEPHAGERTWRNLLKSDASVDLVHFT